MKRTRDRLLLAAGLVCVGAGAVLLFAPGAVSGLGPLEPLTDIDTATQVGLLLGLLVAVVAALQMRRTAQDSLDRSGLRPAPPEQPRDATVPRPSRPLANTYQQVSGRIGRSGRSDWHVVAYGRRARHTRDVTTGRPDPPAAQSGPPGMSPGSDTNRTGRPSTRQDGGQSLREDRHNRASNRNTGDGTPDRDESNPQATERGDSKGEGRNRTPASNGRQPPRGTGQRSSSREQTAGSKQVREGRQQTAGHEPSGSNSNGRGRGSRASGDSAWRQRRETRQFRRRSQEQLLDLLDDVAETARDTYATATGCDPAAAERAVAAGEWTDDRIAAAFLATDRDAPEFTVIERAAAWLSPERTLDRRLARTLDAIEGHADSYLTYERGETGRTTEDESR